VAIDAVSQGRMLFIATCNSIASLPPELRMRFTLGTFFFDLPTVDERETIWGIYLKKYNVSGDLPNDEGWTGAEIKECCRKAHRLGITLMQAARYIVPVSRSAAEQIKTLRQMASGKFTSASTPGVYQYQENPPASRRRVMGIWKGRSPSCRPRNPRPESPLPNYAGIASGSSTLMRILKIHAQVSALYPARIRPPR
jgi:hypothetical protein